MMRAQIEEDLIYDVGMHEGDDSEFYLKKGFRVVGIEALPSLAQTASERLRTYIESGQLVILNVAVAEKEGPLPFFESLHCSLWGTINPERGKTNDREGYRFVRRTVKGSNFASILKEYGIPYYLKIDIEGAETLCLKALKSFTSRPKFISYEALPASSSVMREEFAFLRTLGYSRFKAVRQDTVDAQRCPFPLGRANMWIIVSWAVPAAFLERKLQEIGWTRPAWRNSMTRSAPATTSSTF